MTALPSRAPLVERGDVARRVKVSRGCLGAEELEAVRGAFEYGYFGLAHLVFEFEQALRDYLGAPEVVAVSSGTAALHVALDALGVGAGDEVIVPSLTFVAAFQAIAATGARPVPCDVEPETLLPDLDHVDALITARTKAVMPVHYAGSVCDPERLAALRARHGVRIVEDAAHAFGATCRGRRVGSRGDVICFSFDSIKNITCGEGGAVACHDASLARVVRQKRALGVDRARGAGAASRGADWRFDVVTRGYRYHMSNINAAIGLAQLRKVEAFLARRRAICRRYDRAFAAIDGLRPLRVDYDEAAPHIYVVRVAAGRRDALMEHLAEAGIETGINYIPNHLHPLFSDPAVRLPHTEAAFGEILTLPLHCALSDEDVDRVIERVASFFGAGREVPL